MCRWGEFEEQCKLRCLSVPLKSIARSAATSFGGHQTWRCVSTVKGALNEESLPFGLVETKVDCSHHADCPKSPKSRRQLASVAWICWTPTNCSRTWLLSPPKVDIPSYHRAVVQDGSKRLESCLDLLDTHQLLSHLAAVTAVMGIVPSHHRAVLQDGSESIASCLDPLDPHQLFLHLAAVTAIGRIAPSHHRAIITDGSKSKSSCLDLSDTHQLISHLAAVTAKVRTAPSHHRPEWLQNPFVLLGFAEHSPTALETCYP